MHVILNRQLFEEVDCFKYLGHKWLLMEDVKCVWCIERMMGIERGEH